MFELKSLPKEAIPEALKKADVQARIHATKVGNLRENGAVTTHLASADPVQILL